MTQYDVYAIGNALVDTEYRISDDFLARHGIQKGLMTLVDTEQQQRLLAALAGETEPVKRASGGSAANTVVALSAFGGKAFYSCKVACDALGDFYMHDLHAAGVDSNLHGPREEGVSGTCVVMVTPDAERTMNTHLGITADVSRRELDLVALSRSRWLYIEGYLCTSDTAREAVATVRRHARAQGTPIAMTFSDPAMVRFFRPQLTEMFADGVDLLFCNEEEACLWTETTSAQTALEALRRQVGAIVITCGGKGALIWDGQEVHQISAEPITPIDSNGAGDMFAGAFLYGLSQEWDHGRAGRFASLAAATVVSHFGPRLPLEQHGELQQTFFRRESEGT